MNHKFSWRKPAGALALVSIIALSATACSPGGRAPDSGNAAAGGPVASTPRIKIALVTHAIPGGTFWDIVRKGAEEAAAKDNVELLYTSDGEGGRQAQLIQQAIDQKVDGIAVTLAKPDALKDVLKKAEAAGIPVVSLNSGEDVWKNMGAFTHFGSDENIAGAAVGTRLASEGVTHPICVIMEQGNVGLDQRCAGVKTKIPGTENLYVQGTDMTQVSSTVTAKLQATPDADAIIGLGAPYTLSIVKDVAALNLQSKVKVASFDLNGEL
nr:substrate-binding domain-containing protein [Actinomycetota bacterium]